MNIAIIGYGKMGKQIAKLATQNGYVVTHCIDSTEELLNTEIAKDTVAIEFTDPKVCLKNLKILAQKGIHTVVGTTGWYNQMEHVKELTKQYKIGILWSANFSLGVNRFMEMVKEYGTLLQQDGYTPSIHEIHHTEKKDAPSGTAIMLAKQINFLQNHITSDRKEEIQGIHKVSFENDTDKITLTHTAKTRSGFALGALKASDWISKKKGLYTMEDYLNKHEKNLFEGTYTALITPFTDKNEIDYTAIKKLIERQIEGNITGIVLLGTTGEAPTTNAEERKELIRFTIAKVRGRCQVLVGTGSNDTRTCIRLSREAETLGADGLLIATPAYNRPSQTGLLQHFEAIAEAVKIPIMLYNVPGRTGVNMLPKTVLILAQHPNIFAVKEASGDMTQMMELTRKKPKGFTVLSGDDILTLPLLSIGGSGVVSVLSNVYPEKVTSYVNQALTGDFATSRKQHNELLPLMNACFIQTNPLPVKTVLAAMNLIRERFRSPICPMDAPEKNQLLTTFGL